MWENKNAGKNVLYPELPAAFSFAYRVSINNEVLLPKFYSRHQIARNETWGVVFVCVLYERCGVLCVCVVLYERCGFVGELREGDVDTNGSIILKLNFKKYDRR